MVKFDPTEHNVDEVLDKLEEAPPEERQEILAEEQSSEHPRKTILEKFEAELPEGDRAPYPWEVAPENQVRRTSGAR